MSDQRHHCINCGIASWRRNLTIGLHRIEDEGILSVIQQWVAPQVVNNSHLICRGCRNLVINSLRVDGQLLSATTGHPQVCVNCGRSVLRARSHLLHTDTERERRIHTVICEWILPRTISSNRALICHSCWVRANRNVHRFVSSPSGSSASLYDTSEHEEMTSQDTSQVCRVCLALDVKMYDLKDIELRQMFQNITGIVVTENNHSMLERLCWECAGRLKAAAAFRNKALLSDALLQGLANTGEQIRKNDVTLIKENQDYLKSAGTLSIVEVFHTVEIDAQYESTPSISENNDTDKVQNTVRTASIELKESIIKENNDQMGVEDEPMIEVPIKTEIEYDPICSNTGEEQIHIVLETNPLFSDDIPLREDTVNSAYSSPPPGCSHVETKYPIMGYHLKTPIENSESENKNKKPEVKITNRDSISKIVSKKSKEVIIHDNTLKENAKLKNINLKEGGISKKTSKPELLKKT